MSEQNTDNSNNANSANGAESDDGDSFLGRWARRKSQAARTPETEPAQTPDTTPESAEPEGDSACSDADSQPEAEAETPPLGDEDMPPLDSIDSGASVADFFSPRVSKALRQAALKRLFQQSSLPVFDELDDYAGDYTKFTPLGDVVTNEMRHRIEVAKQHLLNKEKAKQEESERLAAIKEEQATAEPATEPAMEPDPELQTDEALAGDNEKSAADSELTDAELTDPEFDTAASHSAEGDSTENSAKNNAAQNPKETPEEFQNDRNAD